MTEAVAIRPETKAARPPAPKTKLVPHGPSAISKALSAIVNKTDPSAELADLVGGFKDVIRFADDKLLKSTRDHYQAIDDTVYSAYHYIRSQDTTVREHLTKGVKAALDRKGISCHEESSVGLYLMKLATGGGRSKMSRQSLCAQAMRRAFEKEVKPGELADWLLKNGGWAGKKRDYVTAVVNERDNITPDDGSSARASWEKHVADSKAQLSAKNEGSFGLGKLFAAENADKFVLLIGTYKATGEVIINGVLPHDNAAVNNACAAWGHAQNAKGTK